MKTLKKSVAFALALVILASVLVLPAMAAPVEHHHECEAACEAADAVQPRYYIGLCNYCGGVTVYQGTTGNSVIGKCTICGKLSLFPQS